MNVVGILNRLNRVLPVPSSCSVGYPDLNTQDNLCMQACLGPWAAASGSTECVARVTCPEGWGRIGSTCQKPTVAQTASAAVAAANGGGGWVCEDEDSLFDPISTTCRSTCPSGFSDLDGSARCYMACPPGLRDVGTFCTAPSFERLSIAPQCNHDNVQIYGRCIPSKWLVYVIPALLLLYVLLRVLVPQSRPIVQHTAHYYGRGHEPHSPHAPEHWQHAPQCSPGCIEEGV
jgi:hypothetical protein